MKIRALEPEDLELLYTIENDPEMWDVGTTNVPYSHYTLRDYISMQHNDLYADRQVRLVITDEEGRGVGLVDLFNYSPENDRAEIGIAILKSSRGKGYAVQTIDYLCHYAHSVFHIHQLVAVVPSTNQSSIVMLEKTGFSKTALLKDWLRADSEYTDALIYQKILGQSHIPR